MRVSKLKVCCLEREEKAALGEGKKACGALFEVIRVLLGWGFLQQGQSLSLCPSLC